MSTDIPFELLVPGERGPDKRQALAARELAPTLGSHSAAAGFYQPDPDLVDAVNVALAVGAPLLLTGEPGTGKTQVAHYLAWYFDIENTLFPLYVRSSTTAEDLLYRFDAVAYLHAANDPANRGKPFRSKSLSKKDFIERGPLWKAYKAEQPSIVLLDEIDKAPRDFPNDLLNVIDQHRFDVPELSLTVERKGPPPLLIITSNSERRLPEPFLRRCIFHHIEFNETLLRRAVAARSMNDFPGLSGAITEAAIQRFIELRQQNIRKHPATAELLVWLTVLAARDDVSETQLKECRLRDLPALSSLIKDRDDLSLLGG